MSAIIPIHINSNLLPYQGAWTMRQVQHLLRRTMFGAKKSDVDFFSKMTLQQSVDALLNIPVAPPAPPVNDYNDDKFKDPNVVYGQTWVTAPQPEGQVGSGRTTSFKHWWMVLLVHQERNIQEKMTLFWHNHLATRQYDVFRPRMSYIHNALLRKNALGNFKNLVRAVSVDPLMLRYLNGSSSHKDHPDENYARELQELFCLGKTDFTEGDVKAAARILTGWRVDDATMAVTFDENEHDFSDKQFSNFYNNTVIKGENGKEGGQKELDALLNMIFLKDETALALCRKMYRFFVYPEIDAATEATVIQSLADILKKNNFEVKPVLKALFTSQHFFNADIQGAMIKSPADFVIGLLREAEIQVPTGIGRDKYEVRADIFYNMCAMLQDLGDPPNVAGWPAYFAPPQYDRFWITNVTALKRAEFTDAMLFWGINSQNKLVTVNADLIKLTKTMPKPEDVNALIRDATAHFLSVEATPDLVQNLKNILLSGKLSEFYWTAAWDDYLKKPDDPEKIETVKNRLQAFYQGIMQAEEFQLF